MRRHLRHSFDVARRRGALSSGVCCWAQVGHATAAAAASARGELTPLLCQSAQVQPPVAQRCSSLISPPIRGEPAYVIILKRAVSTRLLSTIQRMMSTFRGASLSVLGAALTCYCKRVLVNGVCALCHVGVLVSNGALHRHRAPCARHSSANTRLTQCRAGRDV